MQGRRRVVRYAGVALAGLAGCGRAVRSNDVPGGVVFRNRRPSRESVVLRAYRLFDETPGDREPTPVDREATAEGRFGIEPDSRAVSRSFFRAAGTYQLAVQNRGVTVRDRVQLYDTLGGGLGADTVVVTLPAGGEVTLRVTDVD